MMKKLLFATAMVAGFGMALSANAGEIGGAVGGAVGSVGGAVGGIGGAVAGGVSGAVGKTGGAAGDIGGSVTGSAAAAINGTAAGGNAGNVVSNVANFGAKANTTTRANTSTLVAADEIRRLSTLDSVSSVALVDASTSSNIDANAASGTGNAAQVQAALANNASVMTAIMAEDPDFDMSTVVAADVQANGELVIYTN